MGKLIAILSLNVGMNLGLAGLTTFLTSNTADLILLQEVRSSREQIYAMVGGLGYNVEVNIDLDTPSRPGTAVLWKKSLPVDQVFNFVQCRGQIVKIGANIVLNIYAPSGTAKRHERNLFFAQDIFAAFSLFPQSSYILAGDFNCVLQPIDIDNGTGFNQKFCNTLKDLVYSSRLVDAFRFRCFMMEVK